MKGGTKNVHGSHTFREASRRHLVHSTRTSDAKVSEWINRFCVWVLNSDFN